MTGRILIPFLLVSLSWLACKGISNQNIRPNVTRIASTAGRTDGDIVPSPSKEDQEGSGRLFADERQYCDSSPEADAFAEGCTLADAVGDHNPKMIAIWGGKRTNESLFLRGYFDSPETWLEDGLEHFYALNNRFPVDWRELEKSGCFPICPLDPVTGDEYKFGVMPRDETDLLDIGLQISERGWQATRNTQGASDNTYRKETTDLSLRDAQDYGDVGYLMTWFTNGEAMRGEMLARTLHKVVEDYESRRNEMPDNPDKLLDGLWLVMEGWAANDPNVSIHAPSTFVFGLDKNLECVVAFWIDSGNTMYSDVRRYSPWPQGGWTHVPTFREWCHRQADNYYGEDWPDFFDTQPSDYAPPVILWKCSLKIEGQ